MSGHLRLEGMRVAALRPTVLATFGLRETMRLAGSRRPLTTTFLVSLLAACDGAGRPVLAFMGRDADASTAAWAAYLDE
jgi:hypothetical protein